MAKDLTAAQSKMRQSICDAALMLIKRDGQSAVSMRAIAQMLGVSPMMPYNYFAGKDDLLLDLRIRLFHQFAEYMGERVLGDNPALRLVDVARAYLGYGAEYPHEYRLMFDEWSFEDFRAIRQKYPANHFRNDEPWDIVRGCVADCLPDQDADRIDGIAHLIWFQLHGLISLHLSRKLVFGPGMNDLIDSTIDAVLAITTAALDGRKCDFQRHV